MDISTNLNWRDLLPVSFKLLYIVPANLFIMLFIAAVGFTSMWFEPDIASLGNSMRVLVAIGGALCFLVAGSVLNLVVMFLVSATTAGTLGMHEFSLSPTGLREITAVNDSSHAWTGMRIVVKSGSFLVISNGMTAHIIPRRAFASQAHFDVFSDQAVAWWKSSRAPRQAGA